MRRTRTLAALIATAILVAVNSTPADASHASGLHVWSIHSDALESVCVQPVTYPDWTPALQNVSQALVNPSSYHQRAWDPAGGFYRLSFFAWSGVTCSTHPDRGNVISEFWLYTNNTDNCPTNPPSPPSVNCVHHMDRYFSQFTQHWETNWTKVFTYGPNVVSPSAYLHLVNHETGHTLNLADGNGTCQPISIMHSADYGCPGTGFPNYPTSADITSVENAAFQ